MAKNGNRGVSSELQAKLTKAGVSKGVIADFLKKYGPQIGSALLSMLLSMLGKDPSPPAPMMKARKATCEPRECNEDESFCAQMIAHAQVACLEGDHECCLQNLVCALHCSIQCCCPDADVSTDDTEDEDEDDSDNGE